jgi:hypothetical protein
LKKLFVATIIALIVVMILSNNVFGAEIENQKWHIGFGYESQLMDLTIQSQNSSYGSAVSETYTFKVPTNAGFIDFGINPTKNLEWNFRYSKSADSKLVVTNRFSGTSKVTYKAEGRRSELVYQIPYNPSKDQVWFKIIGGTYMSRGVAMISIASANSSTAVRNIFGCEDAMREEMELRGDYIGISAECDIVKNLWLEITGRKVFNGYAKSIVNINGIENVVRDDDPNILMLDASLKAKFVEGVTMKFGYQKTFVDYTLRGAKFSDESSAISLVLDYRF